jgi:hypothetical protein
MISKKRQETTMTIEKRLLWGTALFTGLALAACGDDGGMMTGDDEPPPPDADTSGPQTIRLNDDITEDTTFVAENTYVIPRLKQLFVSNGATLTIEPGTVIQGEQGSVLVITRGAKIEAVGTPEEPIVFTSAEPEGERTAGHWGGVLILGAAPHNINVLSTPPSEEATFEAFTSAIDEGKFGGTDAADDSGTLRYVRIEFGGFNYVSDREFNNLTLCGVGSGTDISYVQLHGGKDDGVELFGGTVDLKYIVSTQNQDDGFDTDNGWQGNGQFILIQNVSPDGVREASNGAESDNHGTAASYAADPRTLPTIYNITFIGDRTYTAGTHMAGVYRRGTGGHYYNMLLTNFPGGLEFRDAATQAQLDAGNLTFQNSILFNNAADGNNWPPPQASGDIVEQTYMENAAWNNRFVDPMLPAAAMSKTAPGFALPAGSPALTGGATPPNDGFFDTTATFVGAVGSEDWTAGWTAYPQPATP